MSRVLDIKRCDLNIKSNNSSHHTELYREERLIVRRGQPFIIILHLNPDSKEFKLGGTSFTLIVETGPLPRKQSGTKFSFSLRDHTVDTEWSASAISNSPRNTVSVSISSSPNSPIGVYSLTLDQEGQKTSLGQFTLLFNAWCPGDAVYMHSEAKRQEYVLAQHGQIYRGTYKRIKGTPWNFGQFEQGILDICLKILDKNPKFLSDADKDCSARRNPVYVSRVLSAMINSCDDSGVLIGAWIKFEGGVHPGLWIGSGDILRKWAKSGPVSYGQCWVFAAVACTGVYCCGPASLRSIKEGELTLKYDTPFIFAEVNADVVDLVSLSNGKFVKFGGSTKSVGCFISTKAVGSDNREDITHQYKYPEGSKEERKVYEKAKHHNKLQQQGEVPGFHLKIKLSDNMIVGSDFEVYAVLTNNLLEARTCNLMFFAKAVSYNGKLGESCGFTSDKVTVPAGEERRVSLRLKYDNYGSVINSDRLIQLSAITINKQTTDYHKAEKIIVLDEPEIKIKLMKEATVNQPVTAEMTLLNPLPEPLQDCSFTVEGVGLTDGKPITAKIEAVGPKQEARASVKFTPSSTGSGVLLVNFDSDKLRNIKSFINVVVKD
ncbi:protein-glutamine gamma-glutamyltransferase 2-like isoform X2 [Seriola dumerili]|uniref:protein-glutamine gamma-glutamyltransferase 2-like isoform X2 n=1 Tax=Seriola dumerili TaxID=41447 RepID=UPI000BBE948F|nr:protein-glutamine gamma-glutamyltransferase 2-like isoform X2 [Seriola dumerili]